MSKLNFPDSTGAEIKIGRDDVYSRIADLERQLRESEAAQAKLRGALVEAVDLAIGAGTRELGRLGAVTDVLALSSSSGSGLCETCGGTGTEYRDTGGNTWASPCPDCGSGLLDAVKVGREALDWLAGQIHSETEDGECLGEHWGGLRADCLSPLCKRLVAALEKLETST